MTDYVWKDTPPGDRLVVYDSVTMKVKDIPDAALRVLCGIGHAVGKPPYDGWRDVVSVPGRVWESTPDMCTYGSRNWEWVTVDPPADWEPMHPGEPYRVLVCPKCGLDGT